MALQDALRSITLAAATAAAAAALGLTVAGAAASLFNAAMPTAATASAQDSLAGQFLIASPDIGDPRFDRTVILMVQHDRDGALGIVINRPIAERPFSELLDLLGEKEATAVAKVRIFLGGPVGLDTGFVVHSAEYQRSNTIAIDGHVAVTSSREILRDIANNKGPAKSLIAFGYAGWRAGQLEGELALRVWSTAPADPKLIFDEDRAKVWDAARAQRTQDL
jgi:putative transcriptional regulator